MHDCPTCKVPLHGHEEVCPSCGTKQYVRSEYRNLPHLPKAPGVNLTPLIVGALIIGIIGFVAMKSSWVGQLVTRGPEKEDPMAKITMVDARQIIETKITEGLLAVGAKGKFTWNSDDKPATKDIQKPVQLTVDTALKDPNQRREIIDPIKPYMDKGQVTTLTMNDSRSHATWTYSLSAAPTTNEDDDQSFISPQNTQQSSSTQAQTSSDITK